MDNIMSEILSMKLAYKFGNSGFDPLPPHLKVPN